MVSYTIETVTILAVTIIGIILAIYIALLKKNGWLDRGNQFYRCPNPECKKIFRKPAEVKDLSQNPAQIHPACPECGTDLKSHLTSPVTKRTVTKAEPTLHQNKPKILPLEKKAEKKQDTESTQIQTEKSPVKTVPTIKHTQNEINTNATNNPRCKHYFGYLANREKQEPIPETCIECPNIVNCMYSSRELKGSTAEIKKWYTP